MDDITISRNIRLIAHLKTQTQKDTTSFVRWQLGKLNVRSPYDPLLCSSPLRLEGCSERMPTYECPYSISPQSKGAAWSSFKDASCGPSKGAAHSPYQRAVCKPSQGSVYSLSHRPAHNPSQVAAHISSQDALHNPCQELHAAPLRVLGMALNWSFMHPL